MALSEEFDVARDAARPAARRHRRPGRAPWPWAIAAGVLVAAGIVAAPEAGADIGVVDAIEEPQLAWQIAVATEVPDADAPPGGPLAPSRRVAVIDGVAVVATDDVVAGYALGSGEQLWQAEDGRFCTLQEPLLCVRDPGTPSARVISVDVRTGATDELALPSAIAAAPTADGIVALVADGTSASVVRLGIDESERWRTTLSDRAFVAYVAIEMTIVGDHVYVPAPSAVLDLATGEAVPDAVSVLARTDAGFRSGYESSAVELADGRVVDLPPNATPLEVDDDPRSARDVVLTSQGVAVVDATGEPVLEIDPDRTPLARLDGHLVTTLAYFGDMISYDLSSGKEVAHVEGWFQCPCLGSGSTLVALGTENTTLDAWDVTSGIRLWSTPLGELGTHDPVALGEDGVLVLDGDRLSFLRWGPE